MLGNSSSLSLFHASLPFCMLVFPLLIKVEIDAEEGENKKSHMAPG